MIVKGTTDLIRLFLLDNSIEYLDGDGWNEVFYNEEEEESSIDLTVIYNYLLDYVLTPIVNRINKYEDDKVSYVNHVGVNMETKELYAVLQLTSGERKIIIS